MKRSLLPLLVTASSLAGLLALSHATAQDTAAPTDTSAPAAVTTQAHPIAVQTDLRRITPIQGDAAAGKAKSTVCAACHGANGMSIAPTFANLAGQPADFLYWQLRDFHATALPTSPMTPMVAKLSEQDMRDLAAYYASLPPSTPAPATTAGAPTDSAVLQQGQSIYLNGNPAKGIPPCQGCHGADATGHPDALRVDANGYTPYAVYPALRGQPFLYLRTQLGRYRSGELQHSTADRIMGPVAHRLDDDSITAIAAWLASLPPATQ